MLLLLLLGLPPRPCASTEADILPEDLLEAALPRVLLEVPRLQKVPEPALSSFRQLLQKPRLEPRPPVTSPPCTCVQPMARIILRQRSS